MLLTTCLVLSSAKLALTAPIHPDVSWRTIRQDLLNRRDDPPLGSRPVELCLITPEYRRNSVTLWQNRPLFVWQGKIGGIGIRQANSEQIIWRQPIAANDRQRVNRVNYTGEPLEPGQAYHWVMFDQADDSQPIRFIPFTVLDGKQRDRIRVRLIILAAQLREKGATTEEMALERANYFTKQQLWSDALQEVYRVDNPSPELETMMAELSTQLCS
ncbi:MAG: hypothetical protein RIE73_25765 [Coleofasciculus sp. C1-SOL-03]|uniref:hypothetical protein n=1 Tax=Coleofasciculus sp. C1-SOL-03 TaxID=3069522 RepID=UPI0032FB55BC